MPQPRRTSKSWLYSLTLTLALTLVRTLTLTLALRLTLTLTLTPSPNPKQAGVPFFYMSGSEFEEVFVGVGAKRVRELFSA